MQYEHELKPLLTDDFLRVLVESARVCGWSVDHVVTCDFVRWCHDVAEKVYPNLEPYGDDEQS